MRASSTKPPEKEKKTARRKISEALLEDRLGLNDDWIERWEDKNGKWVEESRAPEKLPPFVHKFPKADIKKVERDIQRLVEAGCHRQVLFFCLEELSPEATAVRAGRQRISVPEEDEVNVRDLWTKKRTYARREDMEGSANKARSARHVIHNHRRELLLVADTGKFPLPSGLLTEPQSAEDALALLDASLTWVCSLAGAYTAPYEETLLKSKGLLCLTAYVELKADKTKLRGQAHAGLDDPLSALATSVCPKDWSSLDLREKLRKFAKDHPRLDKRLNQKLHELHEFYATK